MVFLIELVCWIGSALMPIELDLVNARNTLSELLLFFEKLMSAIGTLANFNNERTTVIHKH